MRKLLVMVVGLALLAPASAASTLSDAITAAPPRTTSYDGLALGCVGADASFTGQAYCLDGSHADAMATPKGSLSQDNVAFGQLQLNGWQVPTRCNGNGVSGKREQLVYVHVQGEPDISATAIPFLQQRLIPGVNGVFERTTGGKRAVRWVTKKTTTGCVPTVIKLTVPRAANAIGFPFSTIGSAVLHALGGVKVNRSYLIMVDHADPKKDCGLGQVRQDASPGASNRNNSGGAFAMVWANCWTGLVATHELAHTMGAVQPGAPHATDLGHCWDGRDDMCYQDGSPQHQQIICTQPDDFRKLDCNGDDYFTLYPKKGSYLATHWNSADSQFLIDSKPTVLPTQPGQPTDVTVTTVDAHHVRVTWRAGVTQHGAIGSWTVQVGATAGRRTYDATGSYPVTNSLRQVTVSGKVRSALIAVKSNAVQGFAVYGTNASGDGVTSAIVIGGAGSAPSPIHASFRPDPHSRSGAGKLSWTGAKSPSGVITCVAVLVNGARIDGTAGTLAGNTDPNGICDTDPSPWPVQSLAATDVLQVYARNTFGSTEVTVQHS